MVSRNKEQLFGLFAIFCGISILVLTWSNIIEYGSYLAKAAGFGPTIAFIGLAILFFPSYRRERTMRGEDISKLTGTQLITTRWWIILAIGFILGLTHLYFLGFF